MKWIFITCLSLITFKSIGQEDEYLSKNQLNLNVLAPSLSYERQIGNFNSLALTTGLGFTHISSFNDETPSGLYGHPYIASTLRHYFYGKKGRKKENLMNNSGGYVGLFTGYRFKAFNQEVFSPSLDKEEFGFGLVLGAQGNYKNGFHIGFSLGPGWVVAKNRKTQFSLVGEIEIGLIIFSK